MAGHRPFSDLMKDWSPERRARNEAHKAKLEAELMGRAATRDAIEELEAGKACASPALRRLCLISMMTIDRPETAAEFFARRSKGRAVGDLDRILDKVPDRPPEPGDELKAGRPI